MLEKFQSSVPTLARAIVVANQDPDKLGRVKVSYPWAGSANCKTPSEWAFVCQPLASKEAGTFFLPEKGDEVVVFLQGGNLDHPVIIGALYNTKAKPPTSERKGDHNSEGKNTLRYLKTRSGHLLCFDESDEERGIYIQDKEKRRIEIQSKKEKILITDDKDNKIEIDGKNKKITIQTPTSVVELSDKKVKATVEQAQIQITDSKAEVAVGGEKVTLEQSGVTIVSATSIKLGSGASEALIKGMSFMQFFNSHTHITAWGPSSPPMIPMNPSVLSMKVKTE